MKCCAALFLLLATAGANDSSCGPKRPSPVADCEKTDLGSCGNACCGMDFPVVDQGYNATKVYLTVADLLQSKGPDGSLGYVTGPNAAGQNPGDKLPTNIPGLNFRYIFQGTHATTGGFVDTIDFNIEDRPEVSVYARSQGAAGIFLRVFSRSGIHGALGDNGQNYKNVQYLLKAADPDHTIFGAGVVKYGCGGAKTALKALLRGA